MESCCEQNRYKNSPRSEERIKELTGRINRIAGQLNGIQKMLEENRYCGDILIQVSAAESALRSFGYLIFEEHLATCVAEKIRNGEETVIGETVELVKKLR